jgi:hypothetical protein
MNLYYKDIWWKVVDWIHLDREWVLPRDLMNTAMRP